MNPPTMWRPPLATASAEVCEPSAGAWTAAGTMRMPRARHTATALADGQVLVAGGDTSGQSALSSAELDSPAMSEARRDHVSALLPGTGVLVAGERLRSSRT